MAAEAGDRKTIRLALIATYPKMTRLLFEVVKGQGISVKNIFASFDDAVTEAKRIAPHVDAILSRGGTGAMIKEAVDVPVILIPITPFDLAVTIEELEDRPSEIAFSNYARNLYGVRKIEEMYDVKIHEYTFKNVSDIAALVEDVKKKGIPLLIGGNVAVQLAQKEGIRGIEIVSGQEAMFKALQEAIELITTRRQENFRTTRLKVMMDALSEGIMVTDQDANIVVLNPAARRLFQMPGNDIEGRSAQKLFNGIELETALSERRQIRNHFKKINDQTINVCHFPVYLESKFIGVASTFQDVTHIQNLENQIRKTLYTRGFVSKHQFEDIITKDPHMAELKRVAAIYAKASSAILIQGESGTGKELFAQSIHSASACKGGPFVAINCGAIPETLLESELFGYESGAFTGAKKMGKPGLFELAHNGTLFLDEIAEMPLKLQARLLRVIQERELIRIGGDRVIPVNVRIISATNKKLADKVKSGDFREDLYYRLAVFDITLPPLRERKCDIPALFGDLLASMCSNPERTARICEVLMPLLMRYDWPGNVRELQNVAERALLLSDDADQDTSMVFLPQALIRAVQDSDGASGETMALEAELDGGLKAAVAKLEREIIDRLLEQYGGDQDAVMEKLGISRSTLWRKVSE